MGYELHITRASDWVDSMSSPIDRSSWQSLAIGSDNLTSAGSVVMSSNAIDVFQLVGPDNAGPALHWYEGRIVISGVRDSDIDPLLIFATALDAQLVGDDGERYPLTAPSGTAADQAEAAPYRYSKRAIRRMGRVRDTMILDGRGGLKRAGLWYAIRAGTIGIPTPLGRMRRRRRKPLL